MQADALARHRRLRGDDIRVLTGTDDNSLKNVLTAEAAGITTAELVERNARRFANLQVSLQLVFDDFISTSTDPRHPPAVERLRRACEVAGDLYRARYQGLYCVGCEHFYAPGELDSGRCPEHETVPERITEENWFFRLTRYQDQLEALIMSGGLRIVPEFHAREVLAFVRSGLHDFSISRSRERAHGWGIPVPGDPRDVIYVWWDALGNYVSALDYGTDGEAYRRWWLGADERVHVIGKGVLRFHAVYWPAMLLSAGEPQPTSILVHEYLTMSGRKLSKSLGNAIDPEGLAEQFGADTLRWWHPHDPSTGDQGHRAGSRTMLSTRTLATWLRGNLLPEARMASPVAREARRAGADIGYDASPLHVGFPEASWVRSFSASRGDGAMASPGFLPRFRRWGTLQCPGHEEPRSN